MHLDKSLADCQPQTQAAVTSGDRFVSLFERVEYDGKQCGLDADSCVGHFDLQAVVTD